MLVIRKTDGTNRCWYVNNPRPQMTVPELLSIVHISADGQEFDFIKGKFQGLPCPIDQGFATLFGDVARTIVANL